MIGDWSSKCQIFDPLEKLIRMNTKIYIIMIGHWNTILILLISIVINTITATDLNDDYQFTLLY